SRNDARTNTHAQRGIHRALQQRNATDRDERLGHVSAETRTASRGDDNDRGRQGGLRGSRLRGLRLGGQNLVQNARGLLFVGLLGQSELRHQNLACLRKHALLASGKSAVLIATPQVANDLRNLDHVTGCELLEVRLVTARPVGGLLDERSTKNIE